jgi:hypothetical protein
VKRALLAAVAALGLTLGPVAAAEASTNYKSGGCWPSGANSTVMLKASSWWYDAPLYGKKYHVGATSGRVGVYYFNIRSIYIPGYGYATNTRDFTIGFGTHADGYVVATWAVNTVDATLPNRTCRVYL